MIVTDDQKRQAELLNSRFISREEHLIIESSSKNDHRGHLQKLGFFFFFWKKKHIPRRPWSLIWWSQSHETIKENKVWQPKPTPTQTQNKKII